MLYEFLVHTWYGWPLVILACGIGNAVLPMIDDWMQP